MRAKRAGALRRITESRGERNKLVVDQAAQLLEIDAMQRGVRVTAERVQVFAPGPELALTWPGSRRAGSPPSSSTVTLRIDHRSGASTLYKFYARKELGPLLGGMDHTPVGLSS